MFGPHPVELGPILVEIGCDSGDAGQQSAEVRLCRPKFGRTRVCSVPKGARSGSFAPPPPDWPRWPSSAQVCSTLGHVCGRDVYIDFAPTCVSKSVRVRPMSPPCVCSLFLFAASQTRWRSARREGAKRPLPRRPSFSVGATAGCGRRSSSSSWSASRWRLGAVVGCQRGGSSSEGRSRGGKAGRESGAGVAQNSAGSGRRSLGWATEALSDARVRWCRWRRCSSKSELWDAGSGGVVGDPQPGLRAHLPGVPPTDLAPQTHPR